MEGYKILNGIRVKMTDAEIEELKGRPAPTEPTPTLEERLAALENGFSESRKETHGLNERLKKLSKMMGIKDN